MSKYWLSWKGEVDETVVKSGQKHTRPMLDRLWLRTTTVSTTDPSSGPLSPDGLDRLKTASDQRAGSRLRIREPALVLTPGSAKVLPRDRFGVTVKVFGFGADPSILPLGADTPMGTVTDSA